MLLQSTTIIFPLTIFLNFFLTENNVNPMNLQFTHIFFYRYM